MTEKSGAALGADLMQILLAAGHAGDMADVYLEANTTISGTGDGTDGAFSSHQTRTGGTGSPVESAWIGLRDQFQGILGRTCINLQDTETALRQCVATYAGTDGQTRTKLDDLMDEYNDNPDKDLGKITMPTVDDQPHHDRPTMPDVFIDSEDSNEEQS